MNSAHESRVSDEIRDKTVALEEPRRHQLEKEVERVDSIQTMNKDQQRQNQLKIRRERAQLRRKNETVEQRQVRLKNERERADSNRRNETEEQRQARLENARERADSNRRNETEEQSQVRVDQQRNRNVENRKKTKISRHNFCATNRDQQGINARFCERSKRKLSVDDYLLDSMQEDNLSQQNRGLESLPWPAPISCDMKEALLQKFLGQMSMSALEEATCAVCNVRIPVRKSKKLPVSKIPNSHLLQVPEDLEEFIKKENQSKTQL